MLQKTHEEEWLGELAPFLLGEVPLEDWGALVFGEDHVMAEFRFRRGWLDGLHVYFLSLPLARALKRAPQARLLRELTIETIVDCEYQAEPGDNIPADGRFVGLYPLLGATTLGNVRVFRLGVDQGDDYRQFRNYIMTPTVVPVVRQMPRLEELALFANDYNLNELFGLRTLSNLRLLQVYHGEQVHRLQMLNRPTFRHLTHLLLHPHHRAWSAYDEDDRAAGYNIREEGYLPLSVVRPLLYAKHLKDLTHLRLRLSSMGDEGCEEVVRSGILKRLKTLDLRHGCITDAGARTLADSPDVGNLEWLDLDRNALTGEGIRQIRPLRIPVRVDDQQTAAELDQRQYLNEGEFE